MTVTFCGNRDTIDTPELRLWLQKIIKEQIENGAKRFLLGGYGTFDSIAASIVRELKKNDPEVKEILVLAYLNRSVDTSRYDGTIYPPLENVPYRFAILKRNQWMVENADVIIANVRHDWGGAAQMLKYAVKKKRTVFNFSNWQPL